MQQLKRPGGSVAFEDQGAGPLVVLVPGLGDLRHGYRYLGPELVAGGYRAVAMDLRGHGDSSTGWPDYGTAAIGSDVLALIEHCGGGPATVVGNSFGAGAAVWAATERPEAVSGLVLIGPFVRDHALGRGMRLALKAAFGGPWRVRAWSWYYGTLFPSRKPDDFAAYRQALRENLAQPGRFAAVRAMLNRSDAATEARLAHVAVPTMVLMGARDPDFPDPRAEADWIAERVGGTTVMIDEAGHYPHAEFPEATAPALLAFLERHAIPAPDATLGRS